MEFLFDNPDADKNFKQLLRSVQSMQNGVVAESMEKGGIRYEKNWGVPIVDLKQLAQQYEPDHVLALKLWNKKWRETMILATLLDEPAKVPEEQMDFWVKTVEQPELIEQMAMNLFHRTPFAFAKSLEWCRGKKFLVKYAGLMVMSRLALVSKNAIDEMFEPFFEVLQPLAKDSSLTVPLFRSVCQLARRSDTLLKLSLDYANIIADFESDSARKLGAELVSELNSGQYPDGVH